MSASGQSASSATNGQVVDPLDFVDFTEYDSLSYQSPSVSPATSKPQFARPSIQTPITPTTLQSSTQQPMSGPSHQYDQYKQQTGFVPGALATTMAVNQAQMTGYTLDYNLSPNEELFDFNAPQTSPDMDMDFESSPPDAYFFSESTVNPNVIEPAAPSMASNIGRMYPGMHQQAALAKAQAQQRQQQQIIQQQQAQRQQQVKHQRSKSAQPSDPIVEQKITQLLNSMRAKPSANNLQNNQPLLNIQRPKKDEDDMDEDERLLASDEGKKLSSKERRQLRNKVSARAFRSRRKEYISQLESEIAGKVSENGDLRAQNRALLEENRRLSDLTRMLLSSPSFSNFLEHLSTNPAAQQQASQVERPQSEPTQLPKDINPFAAAHQAQQQQIGMAMIPEQSIDFSMLNLETSTDAYNYQPQVFAVLEIPEMPQIDVTVLSGKSSSILDDFKSADSKVEIPVIEAPVFLADSKAQAPELPVLSSTSSNTVADLDSDIYDDEPVSFAKADIKVEAGSEKATSHYYLVDASSDEVNSTKAWKRVQRIFASIEDTMSRLERFTSDL